MQYWSDNLRTWAECVVHLSCGCAWLWSGEQVACCPTCPMQLDLPFGDPS